MQRRAKVARYAQMGMTIGQIATAVRAHRNTVSNDLRAIEEMRRARIVSAEGFNELGKAVEDLETIERMAMESALAVDRKSTERNSFLRTAMTARLERTRVLQEAGVIPKVAEQLQLSGALEILKQPTNELLKRKREILAQLDLAGGKKRVRIREQEEVEFGQPPESDLDNGDEVTL
jgi:hypothetical protein